MKRNALMTIIALCALLLGAGLSFAQQKDKDKSKDKENEFETGERMERTAAAASNVVVTVCVASGDVKVHGWDRNEVRAVADSARQLELRGGGANPAQRIEVVLSNAPKFNENEPLVSACHAVSNLEINVPRGAVVEVKTHSGNIEVDQVAEARIDNASGDIMVSNVKRGIKAKTLSGDVTVTNSAGRMELFTVSGDVDATNVQTNDASDDFTARTTSGDINLEGVRQAKLSANTTSGQVMMTGPLAPRGSYDLMSHSGDVVLNLPSDSSFRLEARALRGEVVTEFAIKSRSDEDARNLLEGQRLTGVYGSGDAAMLNLNTFSGTVRLQKLK